MAFITQTKSRADFRRIAGLKTNQASNKLQQANNQPLQLGGFKAVFFGNFNNSNTTKK